jgi:hypothetical protein
LDANIIGEFILAIYSATTLAFAIQDFPPLVPVLVMFTLSFTYVGFTGLLQAQQRFTTKRPRFISVENGCFSSTQQPPRIPPEMSRIY